MHTKIQNLSNVRPPESQCWGRWVHYPVKSLVLFIQDDLVRELKQTLSSIKLEEKGVYVQASTLGSLEALLEFLRTSKVPVSSRVCAAIAGATVIPVCSHLTLDVCVSPQYAGINIGPVHKKDVMKASTMLEHDPQYVPPSPQRGSS